MKKYGLWSQRNNEPGSNLDVDLDSLPVLPKKITFRYMGTDATVTVEAFQRLRRNRPLSDNGHEQAIHIIKDLRGLTSLPLIHAKLIVEWFLENVERDVE